MYFPNSPTSTSSANPEYLIIDTTPPQLISTVTATPDENINPWASSFDTVQLTTVFAEPVSHADAIKEDGFVKALTPIEIPGTAATSNQLPVRSSKQTSKP